jgi:hypothetical protein
VKFVMPTSLEGLELPALKDLEAQALAAYTDAKDAVDSESPTEEQVAAVELMAAAVKTLRETVGTISAEQEAAAAAIADRLAAARTSLGDPDNTDGDTADGEPVEGEPVVPADPAAADPASGTAPAALAAAGRPYSAPSQTAIAARAKGAGQLRNTQGRAAHALVASAGISGQEPGVRLDVLSLGELVASQLSRYPSGRGGGTDVRLMNQVATIERNFPAALTADGSKDDMDVLDAAVREASLPGGSLIAAGGWCAPSETVYDLCPELESTEGMVSLPEIGITRGGIRYTSGPDFSSIFNSGAFFCQTEAESIANTVKPCFEIPCPSFVEARLDACGTCVKVGILQQRTYPELVSRWLRGTATAHAHKINAKMLAAMEVASTAVAIPASNAAIASVLNAVDLAVTDMRYRLRMRETTTLELVLPLWAKGLFRADHARRQFMSEEAVTDAMINAWFALRGVAVQWVYDWQDTAFGLPAAATAWPSTLKFMIYPAGRFVRGSSPIIELNTLYDSTMLSTNKQLALFFEEGVALITKCHTSWTYSVPVCPSGTTAGTTATACPIV